MANADITSFLCEQSVALVDPQYVIRSVRALLGKSDRLAENAVLALSLLQTADDMIQEIAERLDDYSGDPATPDLGVLMRERQDATCH